MHDSKEKRPVSDDQAPVPEVIAVVPCAGHATRIAPLPCSKELLPVALDRSTAEAPPVKVVSSYLLHKLRTAGIRRAFLILRKGKWDIPDYYGDGAEVGVNLAYLVVRRTYGPPYTIDEAYPFIRGARIAFGFPDILFGPTDAYARGLEALSQSRADLVLGLFRPHDESASDLVDIDSRGRIRKLLIQPHHTRLVWTWIFAVWTPTFTEFMHEYLTVPRTAAQDSGAGLVHELTVGHVIQAAIRAGLQTQSIAFPEHRYLDVGTPQGLVRLASLHGLAEFGVDAPLAAE
ncbi:dTDP-glucose pyrophosphorylase [Starkeya sp. ORNL1]|uniref:nucleotidyltransferase family protein n=1 Tax=Starkeya sp. ORNL1 TaxID=2709380 RepID=UPI00146341D7|nr:dTDP-glucose pyrophosphorylase [Starkeya sp. ORNL1]QJP14832.1 dTDP-glucose pyrophosphorylase [Starkeya sp. ORNL1]